MVRRRSESRLTPVKRRFAGDVRPRWNLYYFLTSRMPHRYVTPVNYVALPKRHLSESGFMPLNRFMRLAATTALGATASLAFASAALADTTISINPGNVAVKAASAEQDCDPTFGGGPYAGKDVWVFNLPGKHNETGDFVTVTAKFTIDDQGTVETVLIDAGAADGDDIVTTSGTSKAY